MTVLIASVVPVHLAGPATSVVHLYMKEVARAAPTYFVVALPKTSTAVLIQ